jgi:hypothetical protein
MYLKVNIAMQLTTLATIKLDEQHDHQHQRASRGKYQPRTMQ